jgi:hypothetical protein
MCTLRTEPCSYRLYPMSTQHDQLAENPPMINYCYLSVDLLLYMYCVTDKAMPHHAYRRPSTNDHFRAGMHCSAYVSG